MKLVTCEQGTREWLLARRGIPTASDANQIITPKTGKLSASAHGYACQLVADRLDHEYGVMDDYVSASMRNGLIFEPEARDFYEFDRSMKVQRVGFCLSDDGRIGCSPDGLCGDEGGLELKSPNAKTHVQYLVAGGLVEAYKPQIHFSMIVTGRKWWDAMSYRRGFPPVLVRVFPDEYTDALREAIKGFLAIYDEIWAKVSSALGDVPQTPGTAVDDEAAELAFLAGTPRNLEDTP